MSRLAIVVATRNRPEKLARTLDGLRRQAGATHEIVVVDDGSDPPLSASLSVAGASLKVLRTPGIGRSAARNIGGREAAGDVLLFVDDDISVGPEFSSYHAWAHEEWPDALVTGAIRLPPKSLQTPFGRFRQRLEDEGVPQVRGPVQAANFCAAGNTSIRRARFLALDGFNPELASGEDQDLALRHCSRGGRTVYLPEASGIHEDDALDIRSYCGRAEWGAEALIPFLERHPELPENRRRFEVNGPLDCASDSLHVSLRKVLKAALRGPTTLTVLFAVAGWLERNAPQSSALPRVYRLLLGIHLMRGHRAGLGRGRS